MNIVESHFKPDKCCGILANCLKLDFWSRKPKQMEAKLDANDNSKV